MVVKPYDFIVKNGRELLQPAVKCRGREYLRIIYGPEYTMDENIERLRTEQWERNARWLFGSFRWEWKRLNAL